MCIEEMITQVGAVALIQFETELLENAEKNWLPSQTKMQIISNLFYDFIYIHINHSNLISYHNHHNMFCSKHYFAHAHN